MGVVNFDICNYFEKMVGERGKKNILWNYKFCIILTTFHPRSTMAHKGHVANKKDALQTKKKNIARKTTGAVTKKEALLTLPVGLGTHQLRVSLPFSSSGQVVYL